MKHKPSPLNSVTHYTVPAQFGDGTIFSVPGAELRLVFSTPFDVKISVPTHSHLSHTPHHSLTGQITWKINRIQGWLSVEDFAFKHTAWGIQISYNILTQILYLCV